MRGGIRNVKRREEAGDGLLLAFRDLNDLCENCEETRILNKSREIHFRVIY
jgi:hypothetical protein